MKPKAVSPSMDFRRGETETSLSGDETEDLQGRGILWRVSGALAVTLSLAALGLVGAVFCLGPEFPRMVEDGGVPGLRVAIATVALLMVVGPLAILAMVWMVVRRERRQTHALRLLRDNREAMRDSRDQLRRVFASLPLPYVLTRMDGTLVQANAQALALFEVEPRVMKQANVFDFFTDTNFREELKGYLAEDGRFENFEVCMNSTSGETFWVLFSSARVEMEGETFHFAAFSDITERKRIERALQENEVALRSMLDSSPFPIVLTGFKDGCLAYANLAAARQFGADIQDLLGTPASSFWDREAHRKAMIAEIEEKGRIEDWEVRFKDRRGRPFWALLSAALLRLKGNLLIYAAFADITERKRKESVLHVLATTDPLTGAMNRRAFTERAKEEYERARRAGYPVSVMIGDLDCFKRVNDTHGHAVGDLALKHFTAIVTELIRPGDVLGRIGGEEFAVLLPGSDAQAAATVAERIRSHLDASRVELPGGGEGLRLTVSIGVAGWMTGESLDSTLGYADDALYRAKEAGRNRVVAWSAEEFAQPSLPFPDPAKPGPQD